MRPNKILLCLFFLIFSLMFIGLSCYEDDVRNPNGPPPPPSEQDAIHLISSDGGQSWTTEIIYSAHTLNSITEKKDTIFYIAGYTAENIGTVLCYNYLTDNWYNSSSNGTIYEFRSLKRISEDRMAVISTQAHATGKKGIYIKRENSDNWENTLEADGINSVHFLSATDGVCVGNFGRIFRTTDGGETWHSIPSPTQTDLLDVNFNGTYGYAVGMLGRIIESTNRGVDWTELTNVPSQQTLRAIEMTDNNTILTVGSNGTILKSTNGGDTWIIIEAPGNLSFNDIEFYYATQVMIAVGSNGTIMRSTNYGNSWYNNSEVTMRALHGIYIDRAGGWHIVGE